MSQDLFPFAKADAFDPDVICLACRRVIRPLEIVAREDNRYVHDKCGGIGALAPQVAYESAIARLEAEVDKWKKIAQIRKKKLEKAIGLETPRLVKGKKRK